MAGLPTAQCIPIRADVSTQTAPSVHKEPLNSVSRMVEGVAVLIQDAPRVRVTNSSVPRMEEARGARTRDAPSPQWVALDFAPLMEGASAAKYQDAKSLPSRPRSTVCGMEGGGNALPVDATKCLEGKRTTAHPTESSAIAPKYSPRYSTGREKVDQCHFRWIIILTLL